MSIKLRIIMFIFSIIVAFITTVVLKKGRIPIKYSLLWYLSSLIILVLSLFPFILETLANLIGFQTISNLIVGILISILLFLTMSLTIITSGQKKKITLLVQEISMLKEKVENNEKIK